MNVAPAHSQFGGSVATRVLRCPASIDLIEKVPAHLRKPSAYADRGTALHAAMVLLLDDSGRHSLDSFVGKTFNNYTITRDDVENALRPAYGYAETLLDQGAEYYLEHRVVFPTVAGAYGTLDLLVRIPGSNPGTSIIHVVDFKFGVGVRVLALCPDGDDEDVINGQLLFYAAAARHSLGGFFAGVETIVLTIVQPMSIEPEAEMVSSVAVTHAELDTFIEIYRGACAAALTTAPHLESGAWCRFCPARPICPAHTAPLLDLAQFAVPPHPGGGAAYLQLLADGLDLVDAIKDIRIALHDQAKRALQRGDLVPGYALSAGRAERHWRDENTALAALTGLGLARSDVIAEAMRSPRQVELRAKARGLQVPQQLIDSHPSGVALTRSENARAPVPGRSEIVRSFSAALEAFQEGGTHDA